MELFIIHIGAVSLVSKRQETSQDSGICFIFNEFYSSMID